MKLDRTTIRYIYNEVSKMQFENKDFEYNPLLYKMRDGVYRDILIMLQQIDPDDKPQTHLKRK